MVPTILVVDDDPRLLNMLRRTLTSENLLVLTASHGQDALDKIQIHHPDLIVLDWMMPVMDGIQVVSQLRASGDRSLILMLTARDTVEDRVQGLDCGADDYLIKPFAPAELLARIHALLRRPLSGAIGDALCYSDLYLAPSTRETRRGEREFELTAKEFDLLLYLMRHPREVLKREQILQEVWGYETGDDNVLEVYIGYLRRKTEAGGEPRIIHTVRGVGYVLRDE